MHDVTYDVILLFHYHFHCLKIQVIFFGMVVLSCYLVIRSFLTSHIVDLSLIAGLFGYNQSRSKVRFFYTKYILLNVLAFALLPKSTINAVNNCKLHR